VTTLPPEHHNEIKDSHFTGPVVQAGSIDRLSIHVGGEAPPRPPLTSWGDRPELTPQLRDLLTAQKDATESLPYKLLGVRQPELTKVYVQQTMRAADRSPEAERRGVAPEHRAAGGDPERRAAGEPGERTLSMTEALNRGGHLMITGDPGAGKSTIGYMYVQQISEYWLEARQGQPPIGEPMLPVRVPARALAENAPWGELLAAGLAAVLGQILDEKPRPELLARRALGARWLVFVDGLDEIVEPRARARVIAALAHRVRRSTDHRLVITTRELPRSELQPLEQAGIDTFEIQPFSPVELDEFARAWFRAQDPLNATKRSAEFVRQVRDSRLRELVRNPLQATIAAITHTLEPDRPLPNSRIDLYERFMTYLLDDGASGRDTFAELRRGVHDDPARLTLLDWLRQHRTALVEQLAIHRLETESPLIEAAREWVADRRPELPEGWQDDLHTVLTGTGVFVPTENDLRFRHHSFAEFLAARRRAGEIPADFPDLEEWIERGLSGAKHVFALFTFVLWGREDHDLGHIMRTLLQGTGERVILAGQLLSEGIEVGEELAAVAVDRLLDLMVCQGAHDGSGDDLEEIGQVLSLFMPQTLGAAALSRLRTLRDNADLAETTRIEAAGVLGHLVDAEAAATWLEDFVQHAGLAALRRGAAMLRDLIQEGPERVENLLVRIASTTEHDHVLTMALIELLLEAERRPPAARLIRGLVGKLRAGPEVEDGILPYTDSDTRLADLWDDGAASWGALADLAARAGCHDEALWAARRAFTSADPRPGEFRDAVDAVLSAGGPGAVAEVVSATAGRPIAHLIQAAEALQLKQHTSAALELAGHALTTPHVKDHESSRAAAIFTTCDATDQLLEQADDLSHLGARRLIQLVSTLPEDKNYPAVQEIARAALVDGSVESWDFSYASEVLLGKDDPTTAQLVYEASLNRGPAFWGEAAVALCAAGHDALGKELIAKVRSLAEVDTWVEVATDLVDNERPADAVDLLTDAAAHLSECTGYRQQQLIRALSESGRKTEAVNVAKRAVVKNLDGYWLGECVAGWIQVGGVASAEGILAEVLRRDVGAKPRMKVADEFARAGLPAAAVKVWLNVLRYHGEALEQGVLAATRLVKTGHRAAATALLTATLADKNLPTQTRDRLRALQAWTSSSADHSV
jgi:hypothetical protein